MAKRAEYDVKQVKRISKMLFSFKNIKRWRKWTNDARKETCWLIVAWWCYIAMSYWSTLACCRQTITRNNIDLSWTEFCIHRRKKDMHLIRNICPEIALLKLLSRLPGANELSALLLGPCWNAWLHLSVVGTNYEFNGWLRGMIRDACRFTTPQCPKLARYTWGMLNLTNSTMH